MNLFVISANGCGAGKTTLANQLGTVVLSHATALRNELQLLYPTCNTVDGDLTEIPWHDRTQVAKEFVVNNRWGLTVRDALIKYGQYKCSEDPTYWAKILGKVIKDYQEPERKFGVTLHNTIAVDDLRKPCELAYLRSEFPDLVHFHLVYPDVLPEPQYPSKELQKVADYTILRFPPKQENKI